MYAIPAPGKGGSTIRDDESRYPDMPHPLPPCNVDCTSCEHEFRSSTQQEKGLLRYSNIVEIKEARNMVGKYISTIAAARGNIRNHLSSNWDQIQAFWYGMSIENRADFLRKACRTLSPNNWSEGRLEYEARGQVYGVVTQAHRATSMLPYFNIEALSEQAEALLGLLRFRTIDSPDKWFCLDNRLLERPWSAGTFSPVYSKCAIDIRGPTYGDVVQWSRPAIHRGDAAGFPRGYLVLETQATLMSNLSTISDCLVKLGNPSISSKVSIESNDSRLQYASAFRREPYQASSTFDFDMLKSTCLNQYNFLRDHVKSLQREPMYFRRYLHIMGESAVNKAANASSHDNMTAMDIDHDLWTLRTWKWIHEEIEGLQALNGKFVDTIRRGHPLPNVYESKLAAIEALLHSVISYHCKHLKMVVPQRSGFSHLFKFRNINGNLAWTLKGETRSDAEQYGNDILDWCLAALTSEFEEDPNAYFELAPIDRGRLFAFLDHYLENASVNERARIDETLYKKLSDLAALTRLLNIIQSHRPRAAPQELKDCVNSNFGNAWRYLRKKRNGITIQQHPLPWDRLGELLNMFRQLPHSFDEVQTQQAQTMMDMFWDIVRDTVAERCKHFGFSKSEIELDLLEWSSGKILVEVPISPFELALVEFVLSEEDLGDEDFSDEDDGEQDEGDMEALEVDEGEALKDSIAENQGELGGSIEPLNIEDTIRPSQGVDKVPSDIAEVPAQALTGAAKPKPVPVPRKTKPVKEKVLKAKPKPKYFVNPKKRRDKAKKAIVAAPPPPPPRIAVKQWSFEVLRSLYPQKKSELGMKSVRFVHLVQALEEAGWECHAVDGSVRSFIPRKDSPFYGKGSINLHDPHPETFVDQTTLFNIGGRLAFWFGWTKHTVVVNMTRK